MRALYAAFGVLAALTWVPSDAAAQLATPGPSGVVMGHVHVVGRDLDAHRRFWGLLGGTPTKNGTLEMIQFPGGYVNLRQGEPAGGTVGSSMDHVGFNVKSMAEWLPRWQAANLRIETTPRPTQVYILGPDDVKVEILEDATIATPVRFHHVHFFVPDPLAAQAWYARMFGAEPGKRGPFDAADLPGINLSFSKAEVPVAPTQGRSIDHVGFEVRNLDAFLKGLVAKGVTLDRDYQRSQAANLMLSYVTDPFGTYLELTEGLTPGTLR